MRKGIETGNALDGLGYLENGRYAAIPSWARFYLEIGGAIGSANDPEGRLVLVIAAPTRAYAAAMIACGVVLSRAVLQSNGGSVKQLGKILALAPGKPIMLRTGNRKLKGRYTGVKEVTDSVDAGGTYIIIRPDEGTEYFVSLENADQIEILDGDSIELPTNQRGYLIEPPGPLLEAIADERLVAALLTKSQLDCVLIGPTSGPLNEELGESEFAIPSEDGELAVGKLRDLLRVRSDLRRGAAHRAQTLPAGSSRIPAFASRLEPFSVVFDGALAYLKWGAYWKEGQIVIVLDRTDNRFWDAVRQVNQQYVESRIDRPLPVRFPNPVPGVELMAFVVEP